MKFIDEYRDPKLARSLVAEIAATVTRPWVLMEICGGQTHTLMRYGIDELLPPRLELVHGPGCPVCVTDWKAIDVSHGPGCPKNLLEEAMDTPNGALVRRCFRLLNAKSIGLTITLADVTEEEFRVLELIEAERQEQIKAGDGHSSPR